MEPQAPKRRGRPRKVVASELPEPALEIEAPQEPEESKEPVKRRPGRPRKADRTQAVAEPVAPKRRGRPPKAKSVDTKQAKEKVDAK